MKKFVVSMLVFILMATSLLACSSGTEDTSNSTSNSGSGNEEPVEITVWWMENREDPVKAISQVIKEFEDENPNIKINLQSYSWADVKPKVLAAINAGSPPDMIQSTADFTVAIKETGVLKPVDDIVQEIDEKYSFYQSQLDPYYYEDHYWSVPIFGMDVNLYYRKDIFEKEGIQPPQTWDELLAAAKALNKDGMNGLAMPVSNTMYTDQIIYNFMITNGGDLYNEKGEITFNTKENIEALAIMKELAAYVPGDAVNWWWQDAVDNFANEKTPMILTLGLPPTFWYHNQPDKREALGVVPFPVGPNSTPGSTSYSNGFMITTDDAAKKEAIKKFLVFFHEPNRSGQFLADSLPGMFLPVTEKTAQSESFNNHEVISFYSDIIETEVKSNENGKLFGFTHGTPPKSIGPIAASNVLGSIVNKMIVEDLTPEEAAEWGQKELERVGNQ